MEARELVELLKEHLQMSAWARETGVKDTHWGFGDADFFVETDDGTFLVTIGKVSE